jgi:hypothetical protein
MTISALVEKIERMGGQFVVEVKTRQASIMWPPEPTPKEQIAFHRLDRLARQQHYCLTAWLLEREASRRWEASGRDPHWWRTDEDHEAHGQ